MSRRQSLVSRSSSQDYLDTWRDYGPFLEQHLKRLWSLYYNTYPTYVSGGITDKTCLILQSLLSKWRSLPFLPGRAPVTCNLAAWLNISEIPNTSTCIYIQMSNIYEHYRHPKRKESLNANQNTQSSPKTHVFAGYVHSGYRFYLWCADSIWYNVGTLSTCAMLVVWEGTAEIIPFHRLSLCILTWKNLKLSKTFCFRTDIIRTPKIYYDIVTFQHGNKDSICHYQVMAIC